MSMSLPFTLNMVSVSCSMLFNFRLPVPITGPRHSSGTEDNFVLFPAGGKRRVLELF